MLARIADVSGPLSVDGNKIAPSVPTAKTFPRFSIFTAAVAARSGFTSSAVLGVYIAARSTVGIATATGVTLTAPAAVVVIAVVLTVATKFSFVPSSDAGYTNLRLTIFD